MALPEPAPLQDDVWPPPPHGQERAFPSPKMRPRVDVFSVLKYGLGFGVGFCLCSLPVFLCDIQALIYPSSQTRDQIVLALVVTVGSVVVTGLFCQWFRFYYRSFGLWMVRGVYAAGVVSLLLLCLRVTFPDLFPRLFVPHGQAL